MKKTLLMRPKGGLIHIGIIILVLFASVSLVFALLKFNENTKASSVARTGPAAYPAPKASSSSSKSTYQYWVRVAGTYDLSCCGDSNPSKVTNSKSYKFVMNGDPDPRGYEAVVCSPSCGGAKSSTKWRGPAVFGPYANGGFFVVDGEQGGTYTTRDADEDGFSDLAEVYMKTDPTRSCPVNSTYSAWPPDINNDGRVDLFHDIYAVAIQNGKTGVRYDLNQDGKVNTKDTLVAAGFFGKSCPEYTPPVTLPSITSSELSLPSSEPGQSSEPSVVVSPKPSPFTEIAAADSDNDGFKDSQEVYMGTNPKLACGTNAWPPDVDDNGTIDLFYDVFTVASANGTNSKRYDLNQDGKVDKADAEIVSSYFGKTCSK